MFAESGYSETTIREIALDQLYYITVAYLNKVFDQKYFYMLLISKVISILPY
jgi:hypothetical protein